jgi:hypothetical protein
MWAKKEAPLEKSFLLCTEALNNKTGA